MRMCAVTTFRVQLVNAEPGIMVK